APDLGAVFIGLEYGLWRKQGGVAALDATSGKELWHQGHAGTTHGSPLYIEKESLVVIGSNDGFLYAYDAKSGVPRWKFLSNGEIKTRPAYDAKNRAVIFGAQSGTLYALSAADGTPIHARDIGVAMYSIPLVEGGIVYAATVDKHFLAIESKTWK